MPNKKDSAFAEDAAKTAKIYRKVMIPRYTYSLNGGDQFAYAFDARSGFSADADEAIRAAGAGVRIDLDPRSGFLEHKGHSGALAGSRLRIPTSRIRAQNFPQNTSINDPDAG